MSENDVKVLKVINNSLYGQAVTWIAQKTGLTYDAAKDICANLYAQGIIGKQGNGRYVARSQK